MLEGMGQTFEHHSIGKVFEQNIFPLKLEWLPQPIIFVNQLECFQKQNAVSVDLSRSGHEFDLKVGTV